MSKVSTDAAKIVGAQPGGLMRALTAASAAAQEAHQKDIQDKLIELNSQTYSSAASYDNVVIIAGYAAFFTLWAGVNKDVTPYCRVVTVTLMGTSLLFYIAWHMLQMLTRQSHEFKRAGVFKHMQDSARFNAEWVSATQAQEVAFQRILRLWPWLFIPSLVLGFGGGIVLTYNALAVALGWPQLTG
jgi:hypothetical protein